MKYLITFLSTMALIWLTGCPGEIPRREREKERNLYYLVMQQQRNKVRECLKVAPDPTCEGIIEKFKEEYRKTGGGFR